MIIDTRTPEQKREDDKRCPTCGHRPSDEFDRLVEQETGSGSLYGMTTENE